MCPAKYRRLKKLAFEAQDQTGEQEFFAQELRCRRFWHDRPFGGGVAKFWLGWLYGGISNFGRSMLRPFLLWFASIFLFALFYLGQSGIWGSGTVQAAHKSKNAMLDMIPHIWQHMTQAANGACVAIQSSPAGEAVYLSFRNALLMGGGDHDTARRVFGCLYGLDGTYPIVPLGVSALSLLQMTVSAALLFLFLLALRNLLKVRYFPELFGGLRRPAHFCERHPVRQILSGAFPAFMDRLGARHRDDVVAGIDVVDFAGHAGRQVGQQIERRAADLVDRHGPAQAANGAAGN